MTDGEVYLFVFGKNVEIKKRKNKRIASYGAIVKNYFLTN